MKVGITVTKTLVMPIICICCRDIKSVDINSNSHYWHGNNEGCSRLLISRPISAGGVLLCVANVNSGGYDYVTLLNMDSTFTTATSRFSCMVSIEN